MNVIATNVRFPAAEYKDLRTLAFLEGKSIAFLIREAVRAYREQRLTSKSQISLVDQFKRDAVKIDVPVLELVKSGRKFE